MIFFCLVRVACKTISVFYFPTTEVATCSPRLPIFESWMRRYLILTKFREYLIFRKVKRHISRVLNFAILRGIYNWSALNFAICFYSLVHVVGLQNITVIIFIVNNSKHNKAQGAVFPQGLLPKTSDRCVPRRVLNPDTNEDLTKIDTLFQAQTRRMTLYSREKQKLIMSWTGQLNFVSVRLLELNIKHDLFPVLVVYALLF